MTRSLAEVVADINDYTMDHVPLEQVARVDQGAAAGYEELKLRGVDLADPACARIVGETCMWILDRTRQVSDGHATVVIPSVTIADQAGWWAVVGGCMGAVFNAANAIAERHSGALA